MHAGTLRSGIDCRWLLLSSMQIALHMQQAQGEMTLCKHVCMHEVDSGSLLLGLADLLLRRVLQNEGVEAMLHVHLRGCAACLALQEDEILLDLDGCLRVAARVALHILLDEALQEL